MDGWLGSWVGLVGLSRLVELGWVEGVGGLSEWEGLNFVD